VKRVNRAREPGIAELSLAPRLHASAIMKKLSNKTFALGLTCESIRRLSSQELTSVAGGVTLACLTKTCLTVCTLCPLPVPPITRID
jgi:hypothetical protein